MNNYKKTIKIILPTLAIGLAAGAVATVSVTSNNANSTKPHIEDNAQNDQLGNQPSFAIPGG
jgi:hypothetical protein